MVNSIIQELGQYQGNQLYIKREDLIPFSFGGNKARKAALFFEDFDKGDMIVLLLMEVALPIIVEW